MSDLKHYVGAINVEVSSGEFMEVLPLNGYRGTTDMYMIGGMYELPWDKIHFTPLLKPLSMLTEEQMRQVMALEFVDVDWRGLKYDSEKWPKIYAEMYEHDAFVRSYSWNLNRLKPATTTYLCSQGYDLGLFKEGTYKLITLDKEVI